MNLASARWCDSCERLLTDCLFCDTCIWIFDELASLAAPTVVSRSGVESPPWTRLQGGDENYGNAS